MEPFHDAVQWIDADIVEIPPNMLSTFVDSKRDIVVPLCLHPDGWEYDLNSWYGPRKKPTPEEREQIAQGGTFVPDRTTETKYIKDFVDDESIEFMPLDSVGGTALFIRADVHRQGVVFPTQFLIGAEWEYEGYDGIETEGICYLAKPMGFKCWAMPHVVIMHDAHRI